MDFTLRYEPFSIYLVEGSEFVTSSLIAFGMSVISPGFFHLLRTVADLVHGSLIDSERILVALKDVVALYPLKEEIKSKILPGK